MTPGRLLLPDTHIVSGDRIGDTRVVRVLGSCDSIATNTIAHSPACRATPLSPLR